jgi:hypothetical protein
MGEVKLCAHLLCSPQYCQGKNAYICGNNNFFAFPRFSFCSNNHTKIGEMPPGGKRSLLAVEAFCWSYFEAAAEAY